LQFTIEILVFSFNKISEVKADKQDFSYDMPTCAPQNAYRETAGFIDENGAMGKLVTNLPICQ
jgi:hypothetical protein